MNTVKTFRLFISSTFDNFKVERNLLQDEVFPEIDKYCQEKGYQFQPIDLRWGINFESQLDQQTMNICLDEVKECSNYPHPNFLILSGDRYGWVPLPYEINESLFEEIKKLYESNENDCKLLTSWYKLDKNRVIDIDGKTENCYILQSRYFKDKKRNNDLWYVTDIENNLLKLLQDAIKDLDIKQSIKEKYFTSATEQEAQIGIFNSDSKYGFAYIKDSKDSNISSEVKSFRTKIETHLDNDNIFEDKFVEKTKAFLVNSINAQIDKFISIDNLTKEKNEHLKFLNNKTKIFVGREKELTQIDNYIKFPNNKIFLLTGISGIGKSAIVTKAIKNITNQDVVYRFVGASASSVNSRSLLISIIDELASEELIEFDGNYEIEDYKFKQQINDLLKSIDKRVSIVIDAIDQLTTKDDLQWLPLEIQDDVSIVMSVLNDDDYQEDSSYFNQLQSYTIDENILTVKKFNNENQEDSEELLDALLKSIERTLNPKQKKYVLEKFNKNGSALYMKISIEIIRYWDSDTENLNLKDDTQELVIQWIKSLYNLHHHKQKIIEMILGLIKASKDGLSEKEIIDILSNDKDILKIVENKFHGKLERLPVFIWSRIHHHLEPFLIVKDIDDQNLMKFFHRQFDGAVDKFYYNENKVELHQKLANYFYGLNSYKEIGKNIYSLRSLNELPYHFRNSNQLKKLENCLCDLEFAFEIYDNVKNENFRYELENAVEIIEDNTNIQIFGSFYREKEHLILKVNKETWKPRQSLLQLAYEDGDDSPLSWQAYRMINTKKINFIWLKNEYRQKKLQRSGLVKVFNRIDGVVKQKNERLLVYSDNSFTKTFNQNTLVLDTLCTYVSQEKESSFFFQYLKTLPSERKLYSASDGTLIVYDICGKELHKLKGHEGSRNEAFELREGRIVSYSSDNTLIIWTQDGKELCVLKGHEDSINGAFELKNGRILSHSSDNTIRIWNRNGICKQVFLLSIYSLIKGIHELKNGKIILYFSDRTSKILNTDGNILGIPLGFKDGSLSTILELNNHKILTYCYREEDFDQRVDPRIPFCGDYKYLIIWNYNLNTLSILKGHEDSINGALELRDGRILSYSSDSTLRIWSEDGKEQYVLKGHEDSINGALELRDGRILSYSSDSTLRIWSEDGKEQYVLKGHEDSIKEALELRDGRILSYSFDNTLRIWDCNNNILISESYLNNESILNKKIIAKKDNKLTARYYDSEFICNDYKLDDGRILAYGTDGNIYVEKNNELITTWEGHQNIISSRLELTNTNIISDSIDGAIIIWDSKGKKVEESKIPKSDEYYSSYVSKELNNGKIIYFSHDGSIVILETNGKIERIQEYNINNISGVIDLENGKILIDTEDNMMYLLDVYKYQIIQSITYLLIDTFDFKGIYKNKLIFNNLKKELLKYSLYKGNKEINFEDLK